MKFILLSVVCLLGVAVASPALTKQKRDILKGDSRYGTEYHLKHQHVHDHHHGSNEVEVARALGGYVGSYNVPDNTVDQNNVNFQPLPTGYGPPNFTPGKPIATPQITGAVQQTIQEVPAFPQQSTISNFKTAENVETISNGYRAPVQAAQLTPVPNYQPAVHQQVQLNADQVEAQYLPPVAQKTIQQTVVETVQKPVDSYGIPIPESVYAAPAIENQQHDDVIEIKSQDTSSSDVNADVQVTPAVTVRHEVQTVQDTPVHHDVSAQAHTDVKAAQTQGQLNHVHHVAQPAVTHQVQKTATPAVQQQNIFQQSAQQFPDFYAGLSSGSFGGSFDGFRNFGSLDSGYQSYGVPSFGPSAAPQTYDSGFGNLGFDYQQAFNGNQNQGSYSTGAVQRDSTVSQFPQGSSSGQSQQLSQIPFFGQNQQFPQVQGFGQNQVFPQIQGFAQNQQFPQITGFGQNQQLPQLPSFGQNQQLPQLPSFGQNQQLPQLPSFGQNQQVSNVFPTQTPNFVPTQLNPQFPSNQQGNNQANVQPAQPTASAKSDSVSVKTANTQQVPPAAVRVNTHSNANGFVQQTPSFPVNNGYFY